MNRTLTYTIPESSHGFKVSQYLKHRGYSDRNLTELKKIPDSVLTNGTPAYMNQRLSANDILTVHIRENTSSENILPVPLPLTIIYEDADLLIIDKPAGMPVHPSSNHNHNTLANALAWHFAQQNIPFVFRCTNRLDQDTSGLVLVAKHMVSSAVIASMVKRHDIHREYLAIVRGNITPSSGTINAPLSRKPGNIIEQEVDFVHGENAVTHYHTLTQKNGYSLVSLILETGRTHQIRVHMKYLGFPLIGDYLYNPDMEQIGRQALHSYRLSFSHPITGKQMEFTAPMPDDMQNVVRTLMM